MQRGNACSWMVWTPPVRHSRSDTRAPANSIASTAASSGNRPCEIFGLFALQVLRRWSRLVIFRTLSERLAAGWSQPEVCSTAHEGLVTGRLLASDCRSLLGRLAVLIRTTC